jgi:hypothetical protein
MFAAELTVKELHGSVVFCQTPGCGCVAAFLVRREEPTGSIRLDAFCPVHAGPFADRFTSPKPNGNEPGRALTSKAIA